MTKVNQKIPDGIRKLTFEEALKALEEIVSKLESGDASLEESIEVYTRGTWLKRHCEDKLKSAQARIEKITLDEDGKPTGAEPFDGEQG
ncbi:MAG: exodeoxyribonuclease VII small subunit [Proteobacteria bacterium]|nr:exodeoxyribonuclease VII small subunit [Pseudomonadota bacterium]